MPAGKHPLVIEQGVDRDFEIVWSESIDANNDPVDRIDITGYTVNMQVRQTFHSDTPVLSWSTDDSSITINGPQGQIIVHMTSAETASVVPGNYVYDMEIVDGDGKIKRLLKGPCQIDPEVTR